MKIQGWMGEAELTWLSEQASKSRIIAEVGCWKGRTTLCLAESTRGVVWAVDHFRGSKEHSDVFEGKTQGWLWKEFCKNLDQFVGDKLIVRACASLDAAQLIVSQGIKFDLVFLDASHDYESVKADIEAWLPLVIRGGILCGHDYQPSWPGVIQAVDELLPYAKQVAGITSSIWSYTV